MASITHRAYVQFKDLFYRLYLEMTSRYRGYCFTVNNYDDDDVDVLLDLHFQYMVIGFEEGEKGTPHIQGYVYFHNGITFQTAKKKLPEGCHIERQKGTPEQASIYCMKDKDFYEFGELPCKGKAKFEQIKAAMENPEDNFQLFNQYRRSYREFLAIKQKHLDFDRQLYFIHESRRYTVTFEDFEVFQDEDITTYDLEPCIVIPCYSSFNIEAWINGYAPRIRRGYEVIHVNPFHVYIYYSDAKELNYLKKKYMSIDYKCLSNDLSDPEEQLNEEQETHVDVL